MLRVSPRFRLLMLAHRREYAEDRARRPGDAKPAVDARREAAAYAAPALAPARGHLARSAPIRPPICRPGMAGQMDRLRDHTNKPVEPS